MSAKSKLSIILSLLMYSNNHILELSMLELSRYYCTVKPALSGYWLKKLYKTLRLVTA